MENSISPSIILAVLFLLGFVAFILGLAWLAYKLSTIFYKWLSQRRFFIQFCQRREARRMAKAKRRKPSFGQILVEGFAEPVILTVAVVLLYDHFKSIWNTSPDIAIFWGRINEYTRTNVLIAIFFLVALFLWIVVLMFRYDQEAQRDKAFEDLQKINTDKIVNAIKKLTKEIKNKHGS
jgi:ABC-type anion transport system duplicated permease subunit